MLCLSEVRLSALDDVNVRGYRAFPSPRDKRGGGSVVLVRNEVDAVEVSCQDIKTMCAINDINLSVVRCRLVGEPSVVIASLYNPLGVVELIPIMVSGKNSLRRSRNLDQVLCAEILMVTRTYGLGNTPELTRRDAESKPLWPWVVLYV